MAIKSNNTQGNQFHDESTGQFTSENSSSEEKKAMGLFGLDKKSGILGEGSIVHKKLTPAEQQEQNEQYAMERKIQDLMNYYPEEDEEDDSEEAQASKLLGVDVSEEEDPEVVKDRLDAEKNLDIPYTVKNEFGKETDVSLDEFIDFLKYHKLKFTPIEEEYMRENQRLPERILDNLAPMGKTYTADDLEEDLTDYINGKRWW